MKKAGMLLMLILICFLMGCGLTGEIGKASIEIKKDGKIVETIRESFDKEYYDKKELQEFVQSAIDTYNSDSNKVSITLNSCKVRGTVAEVTMTYNNMLDYIGFNEVEIFADKLANLIDTAYHGQIDLRDREGNSVDLSNVIASDDSYYVVVVTQNCDIKVAGMIVYASEGVEIRSDKAADVTISDEACAYIIYK